MISAKLDLLTYTKSLQSDISVSDFDVARLREYQNLRSHSVAKSQQYEGANIQHFCRG